MAANGHASPTASNLSFANAGNTITQAGFKITTRKLPILKAEPIESMTARLGITLPEMIFGDNLVSIEHIKSGWELEFNTFDALDRVDKTGGSMLQVAHSKEWQSTREKKHEGITEIVKPFDWSYSTDYKGTSSSSPISFQASTSPIPLDLLKRPDPILFFDEVMLYEDEMADNGITLLSCKIRVMPARLLLLCRFFMRLDNVLLRIRDTRVYVDFESGEVIREYVAKEETYEAVRQARKHSHSILQPRGISRCFSLSSSLTYAQVADTTSPAPTPQSSVPTPSKKKLAPEKSRLSGAVLNAAAKWREKATSTTETYVAYGVCDILVKECARQADYTIPQAKEKGGLISKTKDGEDLGVGTGWWYEELGLTPTFSTWAQITFLHMYLLTVRIRSFPPEYAPTWHQHLLDHFFFVAEDRMVRLHGIHARSARNKYLKDLFVQWRGLMAGYDEGLARRQDVVLATAVWRNIFRADEEVDLIGLGTVVSYMRGVLGGLAAMEDQDVTEGGVEFGDPGGQKREVMTRSWMINSDRKETLAKSVK